MDFWDEVSRLRNLASEYGFKYQDDLAAALLDQEATQMAQRFLEREKNETSRFS